MFSSPFQAPSAILSPCLAALLSLASATACKKDTGPSCVPEQNDFSKIRVLIQPTEQLNPDEEGTPLSVVFRVYQLKGDTSLDLVDFATVWQEGGQAAFGEEYLAEQEITVYPDKNDVLEIKPDGDMTHLVAVAIFREPIGRDWFRVWQRPKYHGHSVCNAQKKKQPWPDPCFYVQLDRYLVEGGHTPPAGYDAEAMGVECPGPPMRTPPPEPTGDKKKKKKKKKPKVTLDDVEKAQDAEAPEGPSAPETPGG
jgi:type VI secretion system protein VasD